MQQKTNVNLIKYKNKNFCNVIIPPEDTKILEFNQYLKKKIKKNKMIKHHLLFMQILNVSVKILHQVFQCLHYHHLKKYKISMMYMKVKVVGKIFVNL